VAPRIVGERMGVLMSVYSVIMWNVLELREFARGESNRSLDVFLTNRTDNFGYFPRIVPEMKKE